jgi:two-component system sensor histidine kinase/response regulator
MVLASDEGALKKSSPETEPPLPPAYQGALRAVEDERDQLQLAIDTIPGLVWSALPDGFIDFLNQRWLDYTGLSLQQAGGWGWQAAVCPEDLPGLVETWRNVLSSGAPGEAVARLRRFDGVDRWFLFRAVPLHDRTGKVVKWYGQTIDIEERHRAEALLAGEKQLLEMIVKGAGLRPVLDALCTFVEGMSPGSVAAFLLLKSGDDRLWCASSPTLPPEYAEAIDGTAVGPSALPYGLAVFRKESVVVPELTLEVTESRVRELAAKYGLRSCWSAPIHSGDGNVLGSFTMHSRGAGAPTEDQRNLIQHVTNLASVAIERAQLEDATQRSAHYQAQERAERALRDRLELALRGSDVAIWDFDMPDGDLAKAKLSVVNLGGASLEEGDAGKTAELAARTSLWHPQDRGTVERAIQECLAGSATNFEVEVRVRGDDGAYRWRLSRGAVMRQPDGTPTRFIGSSVDITELKRLETDLRDAKDGAELANRAKDAFLANVSHEIRTPMNAILGMTELVLDTPLSNSQRQSLEIVESAAGSLLGTINDLLDFSKVDTGKLELDRADFLLRAALADIMRVLAVRAHRKGLELICDVDFDVPDAIVGDEGRLRQVLLNLIGNAIKFTEKGEVVVHVTSETPKNARDDVSLRFTVLDTGIGIPRDKQVSVFRAFEQADGSTTRKYGGTGLGLTIASRLVALMGGHIVVESEPGRGSSFSFAATVGRQAQPVQSVRSGPIANLQRLRVLIVDDNAVNRQVLEVWLRRWQMDPTTVSDAAAAMAALRDGAESNRAYALVLLDARMPDTDGIALAVQIRQTSPLVSPRIILLSSGEGADDLGRIPEVRLDARLLKPIAPDELLETIHRVMGGSAGSPLVRQESRRPEETPPSHSDSALRILVAEDNEVNAAFLEQLLVKRGHSPRVVSSGQAAQAFLEEGGYDLLLLDLHMPDVDGFEVVRLRRAHERSTGAHLPVVAVTARSRAEDREMCLAAGMDDFLSKPFLTADLWAVIARVTNAHRAPQDPLDPHVLLAACEGDAALLGRICAVFSSHLPGHLAALDQALDDKDAASLRDVAHKLCGTVATFSTSASDLASAIEDLADVGDLATVAPLVKQLKVACEALRQRAADLSLESLRRAAGEI